MARRFCETVVDAFLHCQTDQQIVKATGLSRRTVYRYRRDPELQRILQERRAAWVSDAAHRMQAGLCDAADALTSIIRDPETPRQVRVNASNALCSQCRALTETADILQRLQRLEAGAGQDVS